MKISKRIRLLLLAATVLLTVLVSSSLSEAKNQDKNPNTVNKNIDTLNKTNQCVGCYLYNASLSGAKLNNVDLSEADLSKADLSKADLSEADLSEAKLINAKLNNADLSGANLSRADLSKANLSGTNFTNTITDGAIGIDRKQPKGVTTPSPSSPSHQH
ncbi:pentapeptide repeat-containing protein [Nostoc sp.]|uniref:pentapeptide repeat-containing protein n=1 Tax=Nostoc sp. TaxID=1180 RepID=UPI002FF6F0E8